ncbi:hypothetical protein OL233_10540 [Vagococcus sp. PNs007]|uniref:Bacterial Pleckstrin homology domain-containing protein n=1 Tax=Vagococcus proximus TaxID=2991417 RepID=A0ABT5X427_9ENTE|nr:hypothetical protein [Vagococcus proximus]MDF0480718.1 hypothetical protein [Vagococcus proximus]
MNTYMKVNNQFYNATFHFSNNCLRVMTYLGVFKRDISILDCREIYYVTSTPVFGGKQIRFVYENKPYILYTQGEGMAEYIETQLGI